MSESIKVDLGERSYPIHIGTGILSSTQLIGEHIKQRQVMVVSNKAVADLYLSELRAQLNPEIEVSICLLPDGEQYKTLDSYSRIIEALMAGKHNRGTVLIALGGGVVGDITGFAAATYQRGVDFIQVPTTLLAQVDSSVGGKTAVNLPGGKNMIGAFYQPRCVLIDVNVLSSLPAREYSAGLAEVIKYGLIYDYDFFVWLESNMAALLDKHPGTLVAAVKRSCLIKSEIVSLDEREQGLRALLNFGHTFGHALEKLSHYKTYLHGEAVSIGMMMAADLSRRMGKLNSADVSRLGAVLSAAGLPCKMRTGYSSSEMISAMGMDKKVVSGALRLIVLDKIGHAYVEDKVDQEQLCEVIDSHV